MARPQLVWFLILAPLVACGGSTAPTAPTPPTASTPSFESRIQFRASEAVIDLQYYDGTYKVGYSACGEFVNRGPGRLVYTLEMTVFGPSGEVYSTSFVDLGPAAVQEAGGRIGCGLMSVYDSDLRHPWGNRYQLRLKGEFDDGTSGMVSAESTVQQLVRTASPPLGVVISEVRTYGPRGESDEFVELQNVSSQPVNLGGWHIETTNGLRPVQPHAPWITLPAVTLQPGCYFLVTNGDRFEGYSGTVRGDTSYDFGNLREYAGLALSDSGSRATDQVAMSYESRYREGTPLEPLQRGLSYRRTADANDNARDFIAGPGDPQNSFTCR